MDSLVLTVIKKDLRRFSFTTQETRMLREGLFRQRANDHAILRFGDDNFRSLFKAKLPPQRRRNYNLAFLSDRRCVHSRIM
jgi:hypothetical protein